MSGPPPGKEVKGTPVQGSGGAVLPPGHFWLSVVGQPKIDAWKEWVASKPEVLVTSTEEDQSGFNRELNSEFVKPPNNFYTFTIPASSNNFGIQGAWFPTTVLGFPNSAAPGITSIDDVVQKPPPPKDLLGQLSDAAESLTPTNPKTLLIGAGVAALALFLLVVAVKESAKKHL